MPQVGSVRGATLVLVGTAPYISRSPNFSRTRPTQATHTPHTAAPQGQQLASGAQYNHGITHGYVLPSRTTAASPSGPAAIAPAGTP